MSTVYILQNQHGYFLGKKDTSKNGAKSNTNKQHEWVDGQDLGAIYRTEHKDEAINMQFEVNSQDVDLRIRVKPYPINSKRHPDIPTDDLPPPLPKVVVDENVENDTDDDSHTEIANGDLLSDANSTDEISHSQTANS